MITAARTLAAALVIAAILSGCAQAGSDSDRVIVAEPAAYPVVQTYSAIRVVADLDYGSSGDVRVDVCLPDEPEPSTVTGTTGQPTVAPRAAVVSIHGGSWSQGDKANPQWRSVCQWLGSEGFVGVSVNYRLAPEHPFPAAIDDVRAVVEWLREDRQLERFTIDPARIGALGGSAGGNLAALLGVEGSGSLVEGTRVAAVVDLSGPTDLTSRGFSLGGVIPSFRAVQLAYLGCAEYVNCPQAVAASPLYAVDSTDPPFFVGHSLEERIPVQQSDAFVAKLRAAGVPTSYVTVEGSRHSIAMLDDDMRARIIAFLREHLEPDALGE